MRKILVTAAVALLGFAGSVLGQTGMAQAQSLTRMKVAAAGANFLGPEGWHDSSLQVERVKPQDVVYLQFNVRVGVVEFRGQGYIPSTTFQIFGQSGQAFLEVDTRSLPDFETLRCDTDPQGVVECTRDDGGLIWMVWTPNDERREKAVSHNHVFQAGQKPWSQDFHFWSATASAQGSILGNALATPADDPLAATVSSIGD